MSLKDSVLSRLAAKDSLLKVVDEINSSDVRFNADAGQKLVLQLISFSVDAVDEETLILWLNILNPLLTKLKPL